MYIPFKKNDNSYQGQVIDTLELGGHGQYDWYFVEVNEFPINRPVSYTPPQGFVPDPKQSMQVASGGTINYEE